MILKKFCPLIFSLTKIEAKINAKAIVITVTTAIIKIVFCKAMNEVHVLKGSDKVIESNKSFVGRKSAPF